MNTHHKTKAQLIAELQELQEQNRKLKQLLNANTLDASLPLIDESLDFIDFNYFELIYNTSPDIAIISRLTDSKVMKVNDGFTKNTGYTREEALNGTRFNLNLWQNPNDRKLLLDEIQKNGTFENIETTMVRKDGTAFKSLVSARLFEFQGEQYVSSISRYITDLKNVEDSLRRSENEIQNKFAALNSIFESSQNIIIFSLDVNYCYTAFTTLHKQTMKLIWGVDIAVGMNMLELIQNPIDRKKAKDNFDQVLKGNHLRFEEEYGDSNLHRAFYEDIYNPIIDNNGVVIGLSVFVLDITDRKNAENENKRIQTILEESQRIGKIGGWELNIDNMELLWTSEMYTIQELDSTFIPKIDKRQDFFTPDSLIKIEEAVKRAIHLGETYDIDVEIITAKGNKKSIRTICQPDLENRKIYGYFQDITERKAIESALKRQNELFDSLINNLPLGVFMVEAPSGKPLLANKEALHLLGRGILPDASKQNLAEVYKAFKNNTQQSYLVDEMPIVKGMQGEHSQIDDMVVERPDGTRTHLEIFGSPVKDEHGNVWASLVSFYDITKRKQDEVALKDREVKYRTLADNTEDIINRFDRNYKHLYASPSAFKLTGIKHQDFIGKSHRDLGFPTEDCDLWEKCIQSVFDSGKSQNQLVEFEGKTGKVYLDWLLSPEYDSENNIISVLGHIRDITEIKKIEQALNYSKKQYEHLFEFSGASMIILDSEGKYLMVNKSSAHQFGLPVSEIIGKSLFDFFPIDVAQKYYNQNKLLIDSEGYKEYEDSFELNGKLKTFYIIDQCLKDEDGKNYAILSSSVDITERKQAEEELKASREQMQNFSSHLLKVRENERAAITLEIHDSVAQYLVALKMEMGIYINRMLKSSETLNCDQIATRMESFVAQIETRMIMNGLRPEQLELLGLIETIEVHLQSFEEIHHIKCNFENTLTQLNIEQEKSIVLFRIFQESLINILKHANATKVDVKLSKIKDLLMLEIIDNGVGFDQNHKIQEDSFGLVSMKEQIKQMNGTFTVTSEIGQGTVVRVEIACD
ncbi:MAG: PAS domain-containing sensor histidine kinase [Paludibacter sp.]